MKQKFKLTALLLVAVMMVTTCITAFPPIEVSAASNFSITSPSDDYTFDYEKMLTIKWTSYSGADHYWLTVKNMDTGETEYNRAVNSTSYSLYVGDFGTEYKIYAAAMDANDNVLNGGSAWDVIYVYTKDDDTFDVSEDYFEFEADGGSDTVCVYASSSYTLSESLSWITLSSTSGSSDKWITITCKANTSTSDREGTITVTHKSSGDKLYIDVYQEGQIPEIDVSEDYLEFSADGGTDTFKVYAEDAYTISESLSWISLSSTSGSSDKTITVTCSKNTSSSSREGTITVKQTSTGEKFTIDVYQEGVTVQKKAPSVELTVSDTEIELGESFTYSGTAYGNDYTLNTVSIGIAYFRSESDYNKYISDSEKYASLCADSVYIRYTDLNVLSKTVEDTIKIGAGCTIEGYALNGSNQYVPYEMSLENAGVYLITLNAWTDAYGTLVKDREAVHVAKPIVEPEIPEVDISVSNSQIKLGESFNYDGTAYGNDYKLNTVSVGIAYFRSESDYQKYISDNEAYASLCVDAVYIRYTNLNVVSKTVEGTIKTGLGCTVTGYALDSNDQYIPHKMSVGNTGVYLITLNAWSEDYGVLVKDREAVVVIKTASETVGDINGDGAVTNKDRFILNRFLAGMVGYTDIDRTLADINGDGDVTQADAEYLTNHLAGIKGFESFPEKDAPCLHTNCDAIYAGKTVFVNNTIKNDGVHSYYHMWYYVCKECGENLGEFQGDDDAIKGASEKNVPCTYNSDGVCSCGGINTTGYASWTAKNITDKQISVYDTPYSTDGSYGKVFVNESVKVLGSKAGRYLIEYTVTGTNAKKQGYVNANFLASVSNYRLEFEFETITLPVSGRTLLLIPKNGSAFYHLYDGVTTIWQTNLLDNLTIEFEHSGSVQDDGYTTLTGKVGGFGTMSAYYIENGKKIYLQTPDYYIVADSSAVYTSGNINVFSDEEKEYISIALDIYFSQDDINVPYELYWSAGENFALCIEKLDDILAALVKDGSATENDYARILSEFIDKYVKIEDVDNKTIDEADESCVDTLLDLFDILKTVKSTVDIGKDLTEKIDDVLNLLNLSKVDSENLLQLLKNVLSILNDETFKDLVKNSPELSKVFCDNGLTINKLVSKLNLIVGNKDFWKNFGDILDKVGLAADLTEFGVSFAVTAFGTWDRHRELLIMMQNAIESIPLSERSENYDVLAKAMELLIDKYDTEFWNKIGNGFKENLPDLGVSLAKIGLTKVLGSVCPVAAGAMALLDVASFFIENFTDVGEESDIIRMRQFYLAFNQGILIEFQDLYNHGQTFSAIYSMVNDTVKMFLNMAIYTNDLAQDVSEYTDADKAVYKKNIEKIKTKFAIYLD